MKRGTLEMSFEYDPENFDGDLTNERVKDTVQDTVLAHPGRVHTCVEVTEDPSPQEGLSNSVLSKLENMEPEAEPLSSLTIGDVFSLDKDSNKFYALVDVEILGEHRDNVWSYVNVATGEFEGLLRDGACPDHHAETVYYYSHHNALQHE